MLLNQIIAIEASSKSHRHSVMSELYKKIQKPDLFTGHARQYQRRDEDAEELPPEEKKVQAKVTDVLGEMDQLLRDHFRIVAQKELGNTEAVANLVVDGTVLATAIPVTYFLFLEKELTDIRAFLDKLPTPDNTDNWYEDPATGMYKTPTVPTYRTKKIQRPIVLYDATEHHPAQTQLITEDVVAGTWQTTKYSGGVSEVRKTQLLQRIDKLIRAVKLAREAANSLEVSVSPTVGDAVLGYLLT